MSDKEQPINEENANGKQDWDYQPGDDGAIAIPVRVVSKQGNPQDEAPPQKPNPEINYSRLGDYNDDEIIREYERRYHGRQADNTQNAQAPYASEPLRKRKNENRGIMGRFWQQFRRFKMPAMHRYPGHAPAETVTDDERLWAAIAHGSALLTFIVMISTGFFGVALSVAIPLGIYLVFRNRSDFVAFHALQAFTFQVVGTIGALLFAVTSMIVLIPLMVIAFVTIIGIPVGLLLIGVLILALFAAFGMTVAMTIYGLIAAFASANGKAYRYPWIADWVDDQLSDGILRKLS